MRRFAACLSALVVWGAVSYAQMMQSIVADQPVAAAGYTGPGDLQSYTFFHALFPYKASFAGSASHPVGNFKRTSDSHTCDVMSDTVLWLGNTSGCSTGADNGTAAATWCGNAGGHCVILNGNVGLYDQVQGNACNAQSCDLPVANAPNSIVVFNCLKGGTVPCLQTTDNPSGLFPATGHTFTPAGPASMIAIGYRSSGTGEYLFIQASGASTPNRIKELNLASPIEIGVFGSSGSVLDTTHDDSTAHSMIGILASGANNSAIMVDGTATVGTTTPSTVSGARPIIFQNNGTNTAIFAGSGYVDNVSWSFPSDNCTNHPSNTACSVQANLKSIAGTP